MERTRSFKRQRYCRTLQKWQFTSWFLSPVVVYVNSCVSGANLAEMWSGQGVLRGSGIVEHYRNGMILSPVVVYVNSCVSGANLAEMWSGQGVLRGSGIVEHYRNGMIYGVVMLVILLGLNIWIYKIRPSESYHKAIAFPKLEPVSESYHKAIAFPKLEPVIKVCSVVPISLLAGLMFSAEVKHVFLWMVVGTVVSALVLSAAFDFLYTLDIRSCIKPKVTDGMILAVLALVVTGYRMDITGVDSFLPDKDKIATMSVQLNSISDAFSYPEGYYGRDVLNEDRLGQDCNHVCTVK